MLVYNQDQALSLVTTMNREMNFNIPVKGLMVVSKGTETYFQVPIYMQNFYCKFNVIEM
jgi:hypothetical protein